MLSPYYGTTINTYGHAYTPSALPAVSSYAVQVCVLLQALSRSFMANAAATQGLSTAFAPPASSANGGNGPAGARNSGGGGGRGSGPSSDCASQHTISVSLGKAWLEILVKLMRRASGGGDGSDPASGAAGSKATAGAAVVAAALEDVATRDALLLLFERTAAGVAAAATAAAAAAGVTGATAAAPNAATSAVVAAVDVRTSGRGGKAPAWADPALVLRLFVLLREVLVRVPNAYVVPLRRRGVLHRLVLLRGVFFKSFSRIFFFFLSRVPRRGSATVHTRSRRQFLVCTLKREYTMLGLTTPTSLSQGVDVILLPVLSDTTGPILTYPVWGWFIHHRVIHHRANRHRQF